MDLNTKVRKTLHGVELQKLNVKEERPRTTEHYMGMPLCKTGYK